MAQSLTRLPKTAEFSIQRIHVKINDHKMEPHTDLLDIIMNINKDEFSDRNTLSQFEKHGISWKMAVEQCVKEMQYDTDVLGWIIFWNVNISTSKVALKNYDDKITCAFSKSVAGRHIATQFIEEIRRCNNWGELHDQMHWKSRFGKDVEKQIIEGLKCHKV